MQESLPGFDTNYSFGKNPPVDAAIDKLNTILNYKGGIACLDENGEKVKRETDHNVLEYPDDLPEEIVTKARAAALVVLQTMQAYPSKAE